MACNLEKLKFDSSQRMLNALSHRLLRHITSFDDIIWHAFNIKGLILVFHQGTKAEKPVNSLK